jgi:hypothetical protein
MNLKRIIKSKAWRNKAMHAEHAIGRFWHGGFTRACRVMAVVIFRKLATSPLVPLCNLALLSNFLARIVPSIQIGVFGAMVIQRAILFDC